MSPSDSAGPGRPPPPSYLQQGPGPAPPPPAGAGGPPGAWAPAVSGGPPKRRSMALRHLISVLVGLFLTPVGIWWTVEGALGAVDEDPFGEGNEAVYVVFLLIGLALLAAVAAAGRLSGLGPAVAALVWGVVPLLTHLFAEDAYTRILEEFDEPVGRWFEEYAVVVFPLVAALLLGAAVAGRWRRARMTRAE